ncbi:MAG: hypothetical protein ABIP64_12615 [Burkholderiales bacterium]
MMRLAVFTLTWLWYGLGNAAEALVSVQNPRPFGYVIGDTLVQQIGIKLDCGASLDEKSLPKIGRINAWLELRSVEISGNNALSDGQYGLKLTYQLLNSPVKIKTLELPAQKFLFNHSGMVSEAKIAEWPLTLAPITPEEVLARDGLEALRPDLPPSGIDTTGYRSRVLAYAAVLAAIVLYWVYRFFGIPFLASRRRPFTLAYREITKLKELPAESSFTQAMALLHQAVNQTAGKSLFAENIDQFLANHPSRDRLAPLMQQFFALSRQEFFASGVVSEQRSLPWLMDFCRTWRDIERGIA